MGSGRRHAHATLPRLVVLERKYSIVEYSTVLYFLLSRAGQKSQRDLSCPRRSGAGSSFGVVCGGL